MSNPAQLYLDLKDNLFLYQYRSSKQLSYLVLAALLKIEIILYNFTLLIFCCYSTSDN